MKSQNIFKIIALVNIEPCPVKVIWPEVVRPPLVGHSVILPKDKDRGKSLDSGSSPLGDFSGLSTEQADGLPGESGTAQPEAEAQSHAGTSAAASPPPLSEDFVWAEGCAGPCAEASSWEGEGSLKTLFLSLTQFPILFQA